MYINRVSGSIVMDQDEQSSHHKYGHGSPGCMAMLSKACLQPYLPVLHVGALVRPLFPVFQPHSGLSDKKKQAQTETQEVPSGQKETLFYCEGD